MGAEHRTDLGAEERLGAEDRPALGDEGRGVVAGLGVLDDPAAGAALAQLVSGRRPSAPAPRFLVRTRPTGAISVPKVRIGLIFSAEPTRAWAAPMRPPLRRYSSVSRQNHMSSPPRVRCTVSTHRLQGLPLGRCFGGGEDEAAEAAGTGLPSTTSIRPR